MESQGGGGRGEKGRGEKVFEEKKWLMFTNRMKTINPQIQEFQETLNTKNMKKTTPKHIATILLKTNDEKKNLKAAKTLYIQ